MKQSKSQDAKQSKKDRAKQIKKQKDKKQLAFNIAYSVLTILLIVALIVDKTTANTVTSDAIFFAIIFFVIELILFMLFINTFVLNKNKKKILISYAINIGNAIIFAINLVISFDIFLLIAFFYNTVLTCYLVIDCLIYKAKYPTAKYMDKKTPVAIFVAFLFVATNALSHTYVQENITFLYALIPMAIIMAVILTLAFTVFKKQTQKTMPKVWTKIGVGVLVLFMSFFYGMMFIDVVNTSIKANPTPMECVIVDKRISSGYRRATRYMIYIMIDDKKVTIDVPSDVYKIKEIDDTLKINYYQGTLNLPYYENAEVA